MTSVPELIISRNIHLKWAVVERLLLTPEVRGLNPVIGKFYIKHYCQL